MAIVRDGMGHVVQRLRENCSLGYSDYTLVGTDYWTDAQIQGYADEYVEVLKRIPLSAFPIESDGTLYYYHYEIPMKWLENNTSGTSYFRLYNGVGSAIGTADYTFDAVNGHVEFAADTAGSIYYADIRHYPIDEISAQIWMLKIAHISANSFNIRMDNHTFNRNQRIEQYTKMMDFYRNKVGASSKRIIRGDMS